MTEDELDHTIASLAMRGYIRFISGYGEVQYEITDKGRFALAEQDMRKWKAAS